MNSRCFVSDRNLATRMATKIDEKRAKIPSGMLVGPQMDPKLSAAVKRQRSDYYVRVGAKINRYRAVTVGAEIMAITPSGSGETDCANVSSRSVRNAADVFSFGTVPIAWNDTT